MSCETEHVQKLNSLFLRLRLFPESDDNVFHLFVILNVRTLPIMQNVSKWRWVEKRHLFPEFIPQIIIECIFCG